MLAKRENRVSSHLLGPHAILDGLVPNAVERPPHFHGALKHVAVVNDEPPVRRTAHRLGVMCALLQPQAGTVLGVQLLDGLLHVLDGEDSETKMEKVADVTYLVLTWLGLERL